MADFSLEVEPLGQLRITFLNGEYKDQTFTSNDKCETIEEKVDNLQKQFDENKIAVNLQLKPNK